MKLNRARINTMIRYFNFLKRLTRDFNRRGLTIEYNVTIKNTGVVQKPILRAESHIEYFDRGGRYINIEIKIPNYKSLKL